MRATSKFSIHFKMRLEREKDGMAPVYLGLSVDGTRSYLALKNYQVQVGHWDTRNGFGKKNTRQGKEINEYLDEIRLIIKGHYRSLESQGKEITLETLKDLFLGNVKKERVPTMADLVDYHNKQAVTLLAKGTMAHYYVTQRYLEKFFKLQYGQADIELDKLNYKFISDFELFLHNHKPKDHQRPMDTNGVLKHLVRLKKMVNLAHKLGWIPGNPFLGFKMKKKRVEKDFLTRHELRAIAEKQFDLERLEIVRDIFVFSCYTGLAYVDVMNLAPNNIVKGLDGGQWIKTSRQKTAMPVTTPILPVAMRIIEQYQDNIRAKAKGTVFPVFSNQKVNSYLKEIADQCGIKKNLSFHIARHTFATTITLSNGVPIETVSKMLGHNKLSTTQIYARVLEQKISDDMADLRQRLSDQLN
jgi:site-specific recombinase XerD